MDFFEFWIRIIFLKKKVTKKANAVIEDNDFIIFFKQMPLSLTAVFYYYCFLNDTVVILNSGIFIYFINSDFNKFSFPTIGFVFKCKKKNVILIFYC